MVELVVNIDLPAVDEDSSEEEDWQTQVTLLPAVLYFWYHFWQYF